MDRFKYCYGKRRGEKAENDTRWMNMYKDKLNTNSVLSDDDIITASKAQNKEIRSVRQTTGNNASSVFPSTKKRPTFDLSYSEPEDSMSPFPLPFSESSNINTGEEHTVEVDNLTNVLKITNESDDKNSGDDNDVSHENLLAHKIKEIIIDDEEEEEEDATTHTSGYDQENNDDIICSDGDDDDINVNVDENRTDDDDDDDRGVDQDEVGLCSDVTYMVNTGGNRRCGGYDHEDKTYKYDYNDLKADGDLKDSKHFATTFLQSDMDLSSHTYSTKDASNTTLDDIIDAIYNDNDDDCDKEGLENDDNDQTSHDPSQIRRGDDTREYWADDETCLDDEPTDDLDDDDCSCESCNLRTSPGCHNHPDCSGCSVKNYGRGNDLTEIMNYSSSRFHGDSDYNFDDSKVCDVDDGKNYDDDDDDGGSDVGDDDDDVTTIHDNHLNTSDDYISETTIQEESRSGYPDNDHEIQDDDDDNDETPCIKDELIRSTLFDSSHVDRKKFCCHDNSIVTNDNATLATCDDRVGVNRDSDENGISLGHEDKNEVTNTHYDDAIHKGDDDDDDDVFLNEGGGDNDSPDHCDTIDQTIQNTNHDDDNEGDRTVKERIDEGNDDHRDDNDGGDDGDDDDDREREERNTTMCSLSIMETSFKRDRRFKRKSLLSSWRVFVGDDLEDPNGDVGHDDDAIDRTLALFNESFATSKKVNKRLSVRGHEEDSRSLSRSLQMVNISKPCSMLEEILKFCGQTKPLNFANVFTKKWMKSCKKIGEGSYAEVFEVEKNDEVMAVKIVPVKNDDDDESDQQSFREILFEMTISRELAKLRGQTDCFVDLKNVWFVCGKYPKILMDAWDVYDCAKTSENDRPDFSKDQHYIVLGFEVGGVPLETFELTSHDQVVSIVRQVSLSLSVAEATLNFEHRDLHLGNMLVRPVPKDLVLSFVHQGRKLEFPSHGLKVTIIDYTLSRMTKNGCTFFKDLLADDSLFQGQGDIQYDVYRDMRVVTGNTWNVFKPDTNVLWLRHLVSKINSFARLHKSSGNNSTFVHDVIDLADRLSMELEECESCMEFVGRSFVFNHGLFD